MLTEKTIDDFVQRYIRPSGRRPLASWRTDSVPLRVFIQVSVMNGSEGIARNLLGPITGVAALFLRSYVRGIGGLIRAACVERGNRRVRGGIFRRSTSQVVIMNRRGAQKNCHWAGLKRLASE